MDQLILFDSFLGNTQSVNGTISYSYGPAVTGVPLSSGQYFTGWWGARLNEQGRPILINTNRNSFISETTTGTVLEWFGLPDGKNLSFCFDNSGIPVFGLTNNTNLQIYYLSGSVQSASWVGSSPALVNNVNVNFPSQVPDLLYPEWKTGEVFCCYTANNSLKYRILSEGFGTERSIFAFTGFTENQSTIGFYHQEQGAPYRFVVGNVDGILLKILISKSYVNYAIDDFQNSKTGILNEPSQTGYIKAGYGNWAKDCELGFTKGRSYSKDIYFVDNFMVYPTGAITNLTRPEYFLPTKFVGLSTGYRRVVI